MYPVSVRRQYIDSNQYLPFFNLKFNVWSYLMRRRV